MNKQGHLIVGFCVGIILILLTHITFNWFDNSLQNILIYTIIIIVYSLLPDSDLRNSTISYVFIVASIVGLMFGYNYNNEFILYLSFALLVMTVIAWNMKHRGIVHSITINVLVSVPLIYFSYDLAVLAFVCFYSHLAADDLWFKIL